MNKIFILYFYFSIQNFIYIIHLEKKNSYFKIINNKLINLITVNN